MKAVNAGVEFLKMAAQALSAFNVGGEWDDAPSIALPHATAFDAIIAAGGDTRRASSSTWPYLWAAVKIKNVEFYVVGPKLEGPLTPSEIAWIEKQGGADA